MAAAEAVTWVVAALLEEDDDRMERAPLRASTAQLKVTVFLVDRAGSINGAEMIAPDTALEAESVVVKSWPSTRLLASKYPAPGKIDFPITEWSHKNARLG